MQQSTRNILLLTSLSILTLLFSMMPVTHVLAANRPNNSISENPEAPNSYHAFTKSVVLIDVGHGGVDGGTSYQGLLEKDINLAIAQKLYLILRSKGYAAVMNRDRDYALSDDNRWLRSSSRHRRDLAQRKSLTEQLPTEVVVSLHANWSKHSDRRGPVVLYQQEGESYLLAESVQQTLNQLYGTSRETVYGKPFYLLNQIKQPAVIIETGFLSNAQDRAMLSSDRSQKQIADAIAQGVIAHLSVW